MFRKLSLAAVAAIALGTAALAPTSASAWWHRGWHHGWHGGPGYSYGAYDGCRRWVATPWGPRLRWVC
jgi:Spy/CpxP family protein refolding chaperone